MDQAVVQHERSEAGFTLIEVMVASVILTVGMLSVAYGIGAGLAVVTTSQQDTIARQKAREALEDVFTARDTSTISFNQICNVGSGPSCIFTSGFTTLTLPGPDGIVNTADDTGVEFYFAPGPDGILGTADDTKVYLYGFQRQIQINVISGILVQVTVTIQYVTEQGIKRLVTISADMSPYV